MTNKFKLRFAFSYSFFLVLIFTTILSFSSRAANYAPVHYCQLHNVIDFMTSRATDIEQRYIFHKAIVKIISRFPPADMGETAYLIYANEGDDNTVEFDYLDPRTLHYLRGLPCAYCADVFNVAIVHFSDQWFALNYEKYVQQYFARVAQLQTNELGKIRSNAFDPIDDVSYQQVFAAAEYLALCTEEKIPPHSHVIFVGRSSLVIYHILRTLKALGDARLASVSLDHVHFSGAPDLKSDANNSPLECLLPSEVEYFHSYLDMLQLPSTLEKIFVVDFVCTGVGILSFINTFDDYWSKRKNPYTLPEIEVLNLPFKGEFERFYVRREQDQIIFTGPVTGALLARCKVTDVFSNEERNMLLPFSNSVSLKKALKQLACDKFQLAGGVYYPHQYWNFENAWRLMLPMSNSGIVQMNLAVRSAVNIAKSASDPALHKLIDVMSSRLYMGITGSCFPADGNNCDVNN